MGLTEEDELFGRVEKLVPLIAAESALAERERRVTDAVIDATADADLFGLVVPSRWGGAGAGLRPLAHTTRILAHGCPATAWTLSFLIMHNWLLTRLPDETQRAVFGERGYALVPAPLAPTGTIERVDAVDGEGGFRVNGRWEWATGVLHGDHVLVHALEVGPTVQGIATRFALVPIDAVTVEDNWYVSGMRATGSNAVRLEDVAVAEAWTLPSTALLEPAVDRGDGLDRHSVMAVLSLVGAAPALGAAEAAVDQFRERLHTRVLAYTLGDRQGDQPAARVRLAHALAEVRAARAAWDAAIDALDAAAASPDGATVRDRAAARLAGASTVRSARNVIAIVAEGSGASVYADSSPLQRLQRDVEVLKGHVAFDWDRAAELVGRVELGLDLGPTDLV